MRASEDDGGFPPRYTPAPPMPTAPVQKSPNFENTGVAGGGMPKPTGGSYFSDPILQGHLDFSKSAMNRLLQPQQINPVLQQAIAALTRMTTQGAPHMDMSWLSQFGNTVAQRQAELNKPGLSASQQDLLRTNVTDPLEAQRTAAKQQVMERMAARGIQPGSGIMEQALLDVDRSFSQMRTTGERDLATKEIAQDEARKNQAVDIGGMLAQLGLSANSADLQGQIAGRGQNLSAAGALGGIGSDLQQEPIQRLMQAYGISSGMAQMPFQSQDMAIRSLQAANNQQIPQADNMGAFVQLLMQLAGQGEGNYQTSLGNNAAFWQMLGQSMPGLMESFATLYGGKHGPKSPGGAPGPGPDGQY